MHGSGGHDHTLLRFFDLNWAELRQLWLCVLDLQPLTLTLDHIFWYPAENIFLTLVTLTLELDLRTCPKYDDPKCVCRNGSAWRAQTERQTHTWTLPKILPLPLLNVGGNDYENACVRTSCESMWYRTPLIALTLTYDLWPLWPWPWPPSWPWTIFSETRPKTGFFYIFDLDDLDLWPMTLTFANSPRYDAPQCVCQNLGP